MSTTISNLFIPNQTPLYSFKKDLPLVQIEDHRSVIRRISSIVYACLKQIIDLLNMVKFYLYFFSKRNVTFLQPTKSGNTYSYKSLPWGKDKSSKGLYLFIHGLQGFPSSWGGYVQKVRAIAPKAHSIAPYVPERGNCSLKTAAKPLLQLVKAYLKKFPGKPIHLVGTSNGARIASYIENHLTVEEMKGRQLNVVSIAGVHYGTKLVDWLDKFYFLPLTGTNRALVKEFLWGSPFAKKLLEKWKAKQIEWKIHEIQTRHLFCIGLEDEKVLWHSSALPSLSGAKYLAFSGENHQTVVSAAQDDILNWITC